MFPDPVTTLGAAAAAEQFLGLAITLTKKIYSTIGAIKDAPAEARKRLAQVEQMQGLARLIISNKSFQTDAIASLLGDCLQDVSKLEASLRKATPTIDAGKPEKVKKAIAAFLKSEEVEAVFKSLDRRIVYLILAMHETNS